MKLMNMLVVIGIGKSFWIDAIKAAASDDLTCAITAPTGLAAFNVRGITIRSTLWRALKKERSGKRPHVNEIFILLALPSRTYYF